MKIYCKISTPQFANNKVHHYHKQWGYFDTQTLMFEPPLGYSPRGDHCVQFNSLKDFEDSRIDNKPKEKKWWQIWK